MKSRSPFPDYGTTTAQEQPSGRSRQRNDWRDAVWFSDLPAVRKMVALTFARHANRGTDSVWVNTKTGMRLAGVSQRTWERSVEDLVARGWLVLVSGARGGRDGGLSARYSLAIPDGMSVNVTSIPSHPDRNERHSDRNERHSDRNERHSGDLVLEEDLTEDCSLAARAANAPDDDDFTAAVERLVDGITESEWDRAHAIAAETGKTAAQVAGIIRAGREGGRA